MVVVAVWVLVACSLLCCGLAVLCIARGRTQADRVVALDILVAAAVVLAVAAALQTGRTVFLDVAIGLSLVGFVGTIGWARLIDRTASGPGPRRGDRR
jgi:multicomponent Na+:H+ antiporter subunit F